MEKLLVGFGVKHDVESVVHLRYLRTFLRLFVVFFALLDFFFLFKSCYDRALNSQSRHFLAPGYHSVTRALTPLVGLIEWREMEL